VATLALFLALSGGIVWAAGRLNGRQIKPNSLPGNRIMKKTRRGTAEEEQVRAPDAPGLDDRRRPGKQPAGG
jgi:hypothetical protein